VDGGATGSRRRWFRGQRGGGEDLDKKSFGGT